MAYMMTMVSRGRGLGVVVKTGVETEVGKCSKALQTRSAMKRTNLQNKLARLGKWLVLVSIVLCSLVTTLGVLRGYSLMTTIKTGTMTMIFKLRTLTNVL
jgi:P-type Ca2+ transporter type 2C